MEITPGPWTRRARAKWPRFKLPLPVRPDPTLREGPEAREGPACHVEKCEGGPKHDVWGRVLAPLFNKEWSNRTRPCGRDPKHGRVPRVMLKSVKKI